MDDMYFLPTPLNYPGMIFYWTFAIIMTSM